ncbi:MAG: truA [Microbacteriaceae bacterium]|nr:truA [Microbacteriaceae bacterium]
MSEATRRLRLEISYDGSNFSGWSNQPGLRTVQGVIEAALATVLARFGPAPVLTVAGRTDAGVHALGQVAHVDLTPAQVAKLERHRGKAASPQTSAPATLQRRLNGIAGLNSDVWITGVSWAPEGFDARFSAVWRRYEYRIADATAPRNPLVRSHTLWHPVPLDGAAMDLAAFSLVGLHDWASYCKPRDGSTTIRDLQQFRWQRRDDGVLVARVVADAFCHSMVRALVGACVAVGEHKLGIESVVEIREQMSRISDFKVMPAKGLTLMEVGYPDDADLGERAEQTRARRGAVTFSEPREAAPGPARHAVSLTAPPSVD